MEQGSQDAVASGLETVRAFVNTLDIEDSRDELASPGELQEWLVSRGLLDAGEAVDEAGLQKAVDLRESLRALMLANNGAMLRPSTTEALNRLSSELCLTVRFMPDGRAGLVPAVSGVAGALGTVLGHVYSAMVDGSWVRMKACRNDTCEWAFYDRSKNHSATWCAMGACGSRVKARNYRQRRKIAAASQH